MKNLFCFGRFYKEKRGRQKRTETKKVTKKDKKGRGRGEERGHCLTHKIYCKIL